ncbi:MAG: hypothetical protein H7A23_24135 [Leptospiraceae bacterium]|nr:hypothetical protein [Leptospiraceae bacterium]MCP5497654.1 hypothetical protein [Leptospiraceae bacterium]
MKTRLIFTAVLILIGFYLECSTIFIHYKEPLQGKRARVRFVTNSRGTAIVSIYKNEKCDGWMNSQSSFLVKSINKNSKSLGIPRTLSGTYDSSGYENGFKEFYVSANSEKYFMFFGGGIGKGSKSFYTCVVPIRYSFQENQDYELSYISDYSNYNISCGVRLRKIIQTDDNMYESKLIKTFPQTDKKTLNNGCKMALLWYELSDLFFILSIYAIFTAL